ncbi:ABC transporter ATP-binding protein [Cognatiyoonia sp. IB215446]|uniref:ABC transporter ATP-binding protein n=1 Tax=Cognatiyoonia sp. IB215446 TaxID=3097355 RepID=UPI002A106A18|nr:ABC transporter ATP-binding protein [Cognatiyoonia sp. IB215446]MDX8349441.1 ABC transporter ATP-binding protein [Cognatiyoonia sp. IB215446]
MIVFDKLTKRYPLQGGGHVTILEEFSGIVPEGVNIGILGRNGAGKSTMMRLIAGSEQPTSGSIYRDGRISWPLGFSGGLHPALTGRQNMRFIADLYDQDLGDIVTFVEDFAEIGRFIDQPVGSYSSGMRARLSFGISMALEFDYYLIDEVIGVGDASFRQKCDDVLTLRRQTTSIFLVSHSARLLRQFCDIGGVIQNGKLTFYETLEEAIEVHAFNQKVVAIDA